MALTANDQSAMDMLAVTVIDEIVYQSNGYIILKKGMNAFVEELGSYACRVSDKLDDATRSEIYCVIGRLMLGLVTIIVGSFVLNGSQNAPLTRQYLSILSHQLRHLGACEFYKLLAEQNEYLMMTLSEVSIEEIEVDSWFYTRSNCVELKMKTSFISFGPKWKFIGKKYRKLRHFCGRFANVFSRNSRIKEDMLLINLEAGAQSRTLQT